MQARAELEEKEQAMAARQKVAEEEMELEKEVEPVESDASGKVRTSARHGQLSIKKAALVADEVIVANKKGEIKTLWSEQG